MRETKPPPGRPAEVSCVVDASLDAKARDSRGPQERKRNGELLGEKSHETIGKCLDWSGSLTKVLNMKPWPIRNSGFTHEYYADCPVRCVNVYQRVINRTFSIPRNKWNWWSGLGRSAEVAMGPPLTAAGMGQSHFTTRERGRGGTSCAVKTVVWSLRFQQLSWLVVWIFFYFPIYWE